MTEPWSPLLEEPPAIAGPLLSGLRRVLPSLLGDALRAPDSVAGPFSAALDVPGDPEARITVSGRNVRHGRHHRRDSLSLEFDGKAWLGNRTVPIDGDVMLDLATRGILRLRLYQPFVV